MTDYPAEFPGQALGLVLAKVKGQQVEVSKLVHAGWNVLGYALGKSLGGPISQVDRGQLTDEEILEAALNSAQDEGALGGVVPWAIVAKIVLKILVGALI